MDARKNERILEQSHFHVGKEVSQGGFIDRKNVLDFDIDQYFESILDKKRDRDIKTYEMNKQAMARAR